MLHWCVLSFNTYSFPLFIFQVTEERRLSVSSNASSTCHCLNADNLLCVTSETLDDTQVYEGKFLNIYCHMYFKPNLNNFFSTWDKISTRQTSSVEIITVLAKSYSFSTLHFIAGSSILHRTTSPLFFLYFILIRNITMN